MITLADTHIHLTDQYHLSKDEIFLYCLTLSHNGYKDWRQIRLGELRLDGTYSLFKERMDEAIRMMPDTKFECITPVRDG
jgi:hypothetical protein